jgi:anti-sigma regulatory factor (Ser/Thr protein kinase)/anti-anti-sigma regulatory factor
MIPTSRPVEQTGNQVLVSGSLSFDSFRGLLAAIHQAAIEKGHTEVALDFSDTTWVDPGPMVAVLAFCIQLRDESDVDFSLVRPRARNVWRLFSNANWAHLVAPQRFSKSTWHPPSGLPASRFRSPEEQGEIVSQIVDAVLASPAGLARPGLAAFEWAVNEITDNVLQHADSAQGGLVQLNHHPNRKQLEFTVADAGRGIPDTMRTTRPSISDPDALQLSIQRGITRDKEVGQGNGLFGTHRASKVGTGDFVIHSGSASIHSDLKARDEAVPVAGTLVVVTLDYSDPEALWRALDIHDTGADPAGDYIENRYEDDSDDVLHFVVRSEASSVGSRSSGRLARAKIENLMAMYPNYPVNIDFGDISVVSSSFADEFIGKLFVRTGALRFMNTIRLRNVSPTVRAVLDRAILQRAGQASEG